MEGDTTDAAPGSQRERGTVDWWHHDHPTFTALSGFFTGMLFVTIVPGGFIGLLRLLFRYDTAESLFPLIAGVLVIPVGLVANQRTRRFGTYMWIGMVLTALVALGVTSLILWYLVAVKN
jgi:hypothetical protein